MMVKSKGCARCGLDHDELHVEKLDRPFAPPECAPIKWTHWARCPTNGQPIMVYVADENEVDLRADMLSGDQHFEAALPVVYQVFSELRAAPAKADGRSGSTEAEEVEAFKAVMREFFGKWKPSK